MKARVSLPGISKAAMDKEIKRQLAEHTRANALEIDAMVLWVLHDRFGFGKRRLKRFFDEFSGAVDELLEWYEMDFSDEAWLCSHKLKEIGVDVEEWNKERGGRFSILKY